MPRFKKGDLVISYTEKHGHNIENIYCIKRVLNTHYDAKNILNIKDNTLNNSSGWSILYKYEDEFDFYE